MTLAQARKQAKRRAVETNHPVYVYKDWTGRYDVWENNWTSAPGSVVNTAMPDGTIR